MEGPESAPSSRHGDAVAEPLEGRPAWNRALYALQCSVEDGRGIVVLDGPEGAGKSTGLRALVRRLPTDFQVVLVAGGALSPGALGLRVLGALGAPQSGDPQREVVLHAERLRAQGRWLVLLVDDSEALPDETVRWLALLAEAPETLARVVLAAREYAVFLDALAGLGTCVDLVRLDPHAVPRATRGGGLVELPEEPAREPALPILPAPEPLGQPAVTAPPSESSRAPPTAEPQSNGLLTIEELLGDTDYPVFSPPQPELAPRPIRSPPASPLPEPAPAAFSMGRAPPRRAPEAPVPTMGARRRSTPKVLGWLVAGFAAAAAIAWLALPAFRERPMPSVSAPAPARPAPKREARVPVTTSRVTPSEREAGAAGTPAPQDAQAAGKVVVSDLGQALALLVEDREGDSHELALRFLRKHGPHSEGYAFLDELDARRPHDPEEAVKILVARSRVRAALCSAWADDSRGEAPGRLGCPAADSAPR
jgi:hypothetical protein